MKAYVDKESQEYLLKKAKKAKKKEEQTIRNRKDTEERKQRGLAEKERQANMSQAEKDKEEEDFRAKEYAWEQEQKEKGKEKSKKRHIERKKERAEEKTGKPKRKYVKKTEEEKEAIKSKKEQKQSIKDYNVSIPVLPEVSAEVDLPEFYAVEKTTNKKTLKKGKSGVKIIKQYKLVNPLTKQRNLAIRDGVLPITLKRKEVDKVSAVDLAPKDIPLSAFVKSDQRKVAKFNLKEKN